MKRKSHVSESNGLLLSLLSLTRSHIEYMRQVCR